MLIYFRPHLKFKPLLDFANRMYKTYYTPSQNVSVDETLVATRGRTSLRQFMRNKVAKFGVKFWVLAESSTGYVMDMVCYLGKVFEPVQQGTLQGTKVVEDLLSRCDMLHKHYHVTVDSFFCSINLAERLLPTTHTSQGQPCQPSHATYNKICQSRSWVCNLHASR